MRFSALVVMAAMSLGALPASSAADSLGVLVMAHGGSPEWNGSVRTAVEQLAVPYPVELAFGMADRATLALSMARLSELGASRVVVVRLFLSGESFLPQTRYLLGLSTEAPAYLMDSGREDSQAPIAPIEHGAWIAIAPEGLSRSAAVGDVLAQRAAALSTDPAREDVVLIAHGMGSDSANDRLLAALAERAAQVERDRPYRRVLVETLREDWTGKRREAEARIRAAVSDAPGTALVVPVRLSGFGPYAEVLDGLDYVADGRGLLPHAAITEWLYAQIYDMACRNAWVSAPECFPDP